jgi:hypothetical protein
MQLLEEALKDGDTVDGALLTIGMAGPLARALEADVARVARATRSQRTLATALKSLVLIGADVPVILPEFAALGETLTDQQWAQLYGLIESSPSVDESWLPMVKQFSTARVDCGDLRLASLVAKLGDTEAAAESVLRMIRRDGGPIGPPSYLLWLGDRINAVVPVVKSEASRLEGEWLAEFARVVRKLLPDEAWSWNVARCAVRGSTAAERREGIAFLLDGDERGKEVLWGEVRSMEGDAQAEVVKQLVWFESRSGRIRGLLAELAAGERATTGRAAAVAALAQLLVSDDRSTGEIDAAVAGVVAQRLDVVLDQDIAIAAESADALWRCEDCRSLIENRVTALLEHESAATRRKASVMTNSTRELRASPRILADIRARIARELDGEVRETLERIAGGG